MKAIPLTQGKFAFVDNEDFIRLSPFKWYAHKDGRTFYAVRMAPRVSGKQKSIRMHEEILGTKGIDHINGSGLDNRRENLRAASSRQNGMNRKKQNGASSQFKGVCWHKNDGKWQAQITVEGKLKYLGQFANESQAAKAYDQAAVRFFGVFAKLNFHS